MKVLLAGQIESKRTEYFLKAAQSLGVDVSFYEIGAFPHGTSQEGIVKIDPPRYKDSDLSNLNNLVKQYMDFLKAAAQNRKLLFLNHPDSIMDTLDKRKCKDILVQNGIAVTPSVDEELHDIEALRQYVGENKTSNLFIKPRYGSGAAGVVAYRCNPSTGSEMIYTSVHEADGKFVNTKKICRINQRARIELLVNFILSQPHIIEKWIPKPKYQNLCYDLRVVYQFGKIDFIVARCSDSPITNLHLNNNALDVNLLGLPPHVISRIESLCKEAMGCFKGLFYAGIDILLSGKSLEPVIIEINAQGDLIYQDIFNENKIYKNQVTRMSKDG
jgi:glutathione synthase/RimK-type ligase-like ATP-grasp enzyme